MRRRPLLLLCIVAPMLVLWLSLAGLLNAQWTRLDQRRFPWAYAESGHPTLTGVWTGRLTTGQGTRRGLLLDLQLVPLNFGRAGRRTGGMNFRYIHRRASDNLTGTLRLCGGPRGEQRFSVRGNVVADDASRFQLRIGVADSTPADGLTPAALRGSWNQHDSLRVDADLYVSHRGARVANPRDAETNTPQRGALHRADSSELRRVCETLWTDP